MKNPLFTIAIPAYKSQYLKEAIDSVLNQTISDFELLIVNDASPHNITAVVNLYDDERIRYVINDSNIGGDDPVKNWNKCLSLAKGEYFSLLCDDDVYAPSFLEELYSLAKLYPSCKVFRSGVKQVDKSGNLIGIYPTCPEWESSIDYLLQLSAGKRFQTISEFMYRREYIVRCGGYYSLPKAWAADRLSVLLFGMDGGIASTPHTLVLFRTSGDNLSGEKGKYTREKVIANAKYTCIIKNMISKEDSSIRNLIIRHREKTENVEMTAYLRMANVKDFLFLWFNRNTEKYHIASKCFLKAIVDKLVYKFK